MRITYRTKPQSVAWVVAPCLRPSVNGASWWNWIAWPWSIRPNCGRIAAGDQSTLKQLLSVIEEETPAALERHREELACLGEKYRREILDKQFLPLIKQEILPIARARPAGGARWARSCGRRFRCGDSAGD